MKIFAITAILATSISGFAQNAAPVNSADISPQKQPLVCKVFIANDIDSKGTLYRLSKGDFKSMLSALSKSNQCVQGRLKGVTGSGLIYQNGSKVAENLTNSEAQDIVDKLQVPCQQLSCSPIEMVESDETAKPLVPGDKVIDMSSLQVGTVKEAFKDGRTMVDFGSQFDRLYLRNFPKEITKSVDCFKSFCEGTEVFVNSSWYPNAKYMRAVIGGVYSNGRMWAKYKYMEGDTFWLNEGTFIPALNTREANGIKVDSKIIDNGDNAIGIVKDIVPGGFYVIHYEKDPSRLYVRSLSEISPAQTGK